MAQHLAVAPGLLFGSLPHLLVLSGHHGQEKRAQQRYGGIGLRVHASTSSRTQLRGTRRSRPSAALRPERSDNTDPPHTRSTHLSDDS
jgi:hypothetical protein